MADESQQSTSVVSVSDANKSLFSDIGDITNVSADLDRYLKRKHKRQIIGTVIGVAIFEILLLYIFLKYFPSDSILLIALVPPLILISIRIYLKVIVHNMFMKQFAQVNSFTYQHAGTVNNLYGSVFSVGHDKKIFNVITGTFQSLPLTLFNYQYTVGSGKNSTSYQCTIFQLDYPSGLPPVFLHSKSVVFGQTYLGRVQRKATKMIELEGSFNKFFTLWVKDQYEIEVLQIFSPDFMVNLEEKWKKFSLEFIHDHIYIYAYHLVSTKVELDSMYRLAQYLITHIEPLAVKMKDDLEALDYIGARRKSKK